MKKIFHWMLVIGLLVFMSAAMLVQAQDDPERQAIIEAVIAATEPEIIQQYSSHDGSYMVQVTVYHCVNIGEQENAYERLDIIDNETGEVHLVAEQVIYCGGLGGYGFSIVRMSENGVYVYYTDARVGQPDGGTVGWTPPVIRVNTTDFTVERLGQVNFSIDGQQLVAWTQGQIRVMSVNDADATSFELLPADLQLITDVIWLPDVSGIIYVQSDNFMIGTRSAVTHIDLATMEQTVLLDTSE